jgi:hypoxanthine phosphoribosyltransferase
LIPHGFVHDRISSLAHEVAEAYYGRCPHLLCVLKGASVFAMRFITALHAEFASVSAASGAPLRGVPFTFAFCNVKSYSGTESTGSVTISGIDEAELSGRDILIVEDIVDTGITLSKLLPHLRDVCKVGRAQVCALLEKRTAKSCGLKARFSGFSIPDAFVIGFGLDYDDAFRDLDHICVINKDGVEAFRGFDRKVRAPSPATE